MVRSTRLRRRLGKAEEAAAMLEALKGNVLANLCGVSAIFCGHIELPR